MRLQGRLADGWGFTLEIPDSSVVARNVLDVKLFIRFARF